MTTTVLCRLCIGSYDEFINLFDELGQANEAHEIAVKYFAPKLLKPQYEHDLTLICINCWSHISEFYNFQQSVAKMQIKLEEDDSTMEQITIISIEEEYNEHMNDNDLNYKLDMPKHGVPIVTENAAFKDLNLNIAIKDWNKSNNNFNNTTDYTEVSYNHKAYEEFMNSDKDSTKYIPNAKENESITDLNKAISNLKNSNANFIGNFKPNILKALEYDAIINKWSSVLECDLCHMQFTGYYFLRQHFYQQHPNEKFYIICCKRKFKNRFDLVEHIRVHLNRNAYQCNICQKALSSHRNLRRHIREVHLKNFQGLTSKLPKNVSNVIERKKLDLKKPRTLKTNKKLTRSFLVPKTNLDVKIAGNLYKSKVSSAAKRESIDYDALISDVKKELQCPICQRTFKVFTLLFQHFKDEHQRKKFHILCCQRQFHSSYQIFNHFQLHTDPKAFKCHICDYVFSRRAYLVRHIRTLHSEKVRWFCDQCDVELKSCSGLKRHRKRCGK